VQYYVFIIIIFIYPMIIYCKYEFPPIFEMCRILFYILYRNLIKTKQ